MLFASVNNYWRSINSAQKTRIWDWKYIILFVMFEHFITELLTCGRNLFYFIVILNINFFKFMPSWFTLSRPVQNSALTLCREAVILPELTMWLTRILRRILVIFRAINHAPDGIRWQFLPSLEETRVKQWQIFRGTAQRDGRNTPVQHSIYLNISYCAQQFVVT